MSISHPAIAKRIVDRLDSTTVTPFAICSDSNGLWPSSTGVAGRFGWWGGWQYGLMQYWSLAGSGVFMPSRLKDGVSNSGIDALRAESLWSHTLAGFGQQGGAPAAQDQFWDDDDGGLSQVESGDTRYSVIHPGQYRYCEVDDATLPTNPRVFPGLLSALTTNPIYKHALKGKFWDVTFDSGAGKITPTILNGATTVAGADILDTNTGSVGVRKTEITLAADAARAFAPTLSWGPNDSVTPKTKLQGPLVTLGNQIVSMDVSGGFTVSVLCQLGGAISEHFDVALNNLSDEGLEWWLSAVCDEQSSINKHLVVVINYGVNEYTLGISQANAQNYLTGGINRLKARWAALGYPADGLLFILQSPHAYGTDPVDVDQEDRDYRDQYYISMSDVAEAVGNATAIDTAAIVRDELMTELGWLDGSAGSHLTYDATSSLAGYQSVSTMVVANLRTAAASSSDGATASEVVAAIKADPDLGTTGLIADAATAVTQTTKENIRSAVNGRWTDEVGGTFDLTITDTP